MGDWSPIDDVSRLMAWAQNVTTCSCFRGAQSSCSLTLVSPKVIGHLIYTSEPQKSEPSTASTCCLMLLEHQECSALSFCGDALGVVGAGIVQQVAPYKLFSKMIHMYILRSIYTYIYIYYIYIYCFWAGVSEVCEPPLRSLIKTRCCCLFLSLNVDPFRANCILDFAWGTNNFRNLSGVFPKTGLAGFWCERVEA